MATPHADQATAPARLRVVDPVAGAGPHWETVYREHVVVVYRYIYSRCGNRADAEDLTTQTFMRALPRIDGSASTAEQRSYLLTSARTALADHWAVHYATRHDALDERIAEETGEPPSDRTEDVEVVLAGLPQRYRTVLELRFLRGYSLRETAAEMEVSLANAKVLQWRALRAAGRCAPEEAE